MGYLAAQNSREIRTLTRSPQSSETDTTYEETCGVSGRCYGAPFVTEQEWLVVDIQQLPLNVHYTCSPNLKI